MERVCTYGHTPPGTRCWCLLKDGLSEEAQDLKKPTAEMLPIGGLFLLEEWGDRTSV